MVSDPRRRPVTSGLTPAVRRKRRTVMSKRMWCVLGLVAILTGLGMALYAKEPQAGQPGQPAGFSGKVVFVQAKVRSATLEEPRLRILGNRAFVVGKSAGDSV